MSAGWSKGRNADPTGGDLTTSKQKGQHVHLRSVSDKVGIVLSMESDVHESDPAPEFPKWLVGADVVADLAKLAAPEEEEAAVDAHFSRDALDGLGDWKDLAPQPIIAVFIN